MIAFQKIEKGSTPKGMRRFHGKFMKAALQWGLHHWHTTYRRLHFVSSAYHRYPIYNLRARRDPKPLYASGASLSASERFDPRGTANNMRAVYRMPNLNFGFKTKKGNRINLREEFMSVNPAEGKKMTEVMRAAYVRQVQNLREEKGRA